MRTDLSVIIFTGCLITTLHAGVITDGTLGNRVDLPGPDFQIESKLGQQHGGNLFHSFQDFNLQSQESATFSGPANVQNIISRVTGGNLSTIDGLIRSTIPDADLYLLNPYGILFGPNAKLDLQGGFHASTADYLRLQEGGRFEARFPNESILTVAPVAAFGFLTDNPAAIQTQGSKLSVPPEKTLSLIGGDIHLSSETPLTADNSQPIPSVMAESILTTEHGRVNLASLASRGEVIPSDNDLTLQGQGGKLTVENTLVELSGNGGGATFIRAGQFVLDNAVIRSNTFGNQDGKDINLKVTEATYLNGVNSEITLTTASLGSTGSIFIETPSLEMNKAIILTASAFMGSAGPIGIHANQILLKDGAIIGSGSLGIGHSGDVVLNASQRLTLTGFYPGFRLSHQQISENARSAILSNSLGVGHSGNIWIDTQELNLDLGGITASGFGTGRCGDITINAQSVRIMKGGLIASGTHQTAHAGSIHVQVSDQLYVAGHAPVAQTSLGRNWGFNFSQVGSGTEGTESGGIIDIQASKVILTEGGQIGADSWNYGTGDAGEIFIKANVLQLTDRGNITTSAERAAGGGIIISASKLLYIYDGEITTSVKGGTSAGGNITIEKPQFIVLNQGQIKAQADEGRGGNIHIVAEQFIPSTTSLVSASSRLGIDGNVEIDAPDETVSDCLLVLPGERMDASALLKRPCSDYVAEEERSHFYIEWTRGRPLSPEGRQGSLILPVPHARF